MPKTFLEWCDLAFERLEKRGISKLAAGTKLGLERDNYIYIVPKNIWRATPAFVDGLARLADFSPAETVAISTAWFIERVTSGKTGPLIKIFIDALGDLPERKREAAIERARQYYLSLRDD